MVGIYMIKNNNNNKVYIGKSINIMTRWNEHMKQGENATKFDDTFHFELNQHPEYFSFNILKICNESELSYWEDYYIKEYDSINSGYNKISAAASIFCDDKEIAHSRKDIIKRLNDIVGKPLFVDDKKKLANFFAYKNKHGVVLGWTTLKKHLIENGFDIIETKRKVNGKMRNCSIISVKYDY